MNYSTKYMTGCYQDLRPFSGGYCPPQRPSPCCCPPPCPPQCGVGNMIDGNNLIYFMIGYLIAKNNK